MSFDPGDYGDNSIWFNPNHRAASTDDQGVFSTDNLPILANGKVGAWMEEWGNDTLAQDDSSDRSSAPFNILWLPNVQNGNAAIRIPDRFAYMSDKNVGMDGLWSDGSPRTVCIAYKPDPSQPAGSADLFGQRVDGDAAGTDFNLQAGAANDPCLNYGGGQVINSNLISDNQWKIVTVVCQGSATQGRTNILFYRNGRFLGMVPNVILNTAQTPLAIGDSAGLGRSCACLIGDIIIYPYALSGDVVPNLIAAMQARWNAGVPLPPTALSASQGTHADKVALAWTAPASADATSYEVWRGTENDAATAVKLAASLTATTYDDAAAPTGVASWYFVRGVNAFGAGDFSAGGLGLRAPGDTPGTGTLLARVGMPPDGHTVAGDAGTAAGAIDNGKAKAKFDWDSDVANKPTIPTLPSDYLNETERQYLSTAATNATTAASNTSNVPSFISTFASWASGLIASMTSAILCGDKSPIETTSGAVKLPAAPAGYGGGLTSDQATQLSAAAEKTGMKLAADGLDAIPTVAPTGPATTFRGMIVQLWRRFFGKAVYDKTAGTIKTYADDGTTLVTTQAASDAGNVETQGRAG